MIRVLVNGARGRMGKIAIQAVERDPQCQLVGVANREDDLSSVIIASSPDVVIDFTVATAAYDNAVTIIESNVCPVIGTSGLTAAQVSDLAMRAQLRNLSGLIVPNFSLGAVLLMRFAAMAAKYFSEVEIVESHHPLKQDAPSGTAMATAQKIASARIAKPTSRAIHETITGSRGARYCDIPIHAIRLPGKMAHEQVIFGGSGETLTLSHDSIDRECFIVGIQLACNKVTAVQGLQVGLDTVLD